MQQFEEKDSHRQLYSKPWVKKEMAWAWIDDTLDDNLL